MGKSKRIFDQLNTKTLGDKPAEELSRIQDPVHIQKMNVEEMETFNIINQATFRDGNIMPDTGGIEEQIQTSDAIAIQFRPPKGQVWKVMGISIYNTPNVTGSNSYYTYLSTDATATADLPSGTREVFYSSYSSNGNLIGTESIFEEVFQPFFITNELYLRMYSNMDNVGTSAEVQFRLAYMRIR